MGEKDDYDSENSWISDGLPSSTDLSLSLSASFFLSLLCVGTFYSGQRKYAGVDHFRCNPVLGK